MLVGRKIAFIYYMPTYVYRSWSLPLIPCIHIQNLKWTEEAKKCQAKVAREHSVGPSPMEKRQTVAQMQLHRGNVVLI